MKPWLWFLLSLLTCTITWSYRHEILIPWKHYVDVERGELKAQMGDLYPGWVGTRELFLHGRNPYGEEVSREIQMGFYGHAIRQTYGRPGVVDEQRFAYPVYVVLLLAPGTHADFLKVQKVAIFVLGTLTIVAAFLCMGALKWHPPPLLTLAIALFLLSSPQVGQGLRLQQLGLLVGFFLAFAIWCITRGYYATAGVLLALATIKPQMIVICIAWLFLWTLGDWNKRWPFVAGFGASLVVLIAIGEFLLHAWIAYFLAGLVAYGKYVAPQSLIRFALGDWAGGGLAIVGLIILVTYAWRHRTVTADSAVFLRILSLFLIASTLVLPLFPVFNQVLLLLPLMMLFRDWNCMPRLTGNLLAVVLAWPAVVSLVLILYRAQISSMRPIPLLPSALAPFLPFLLAILILRRQSEDLRPNVA
jgi:hypothetical protein